MGREKEAKKHDSVSLGVFGHLVTLIKHQSQGHLSDTG